ncbi:TIGR04372 family glycosyltransferase [Sulfurospirillum arsenophilum]|uniref:TIGR04372 family glycosyltransferase n=1 Tax=Sulfurospirillum arsenophilum TaxID=56698 RepID=UPI0005A931B9|nr:TIGR04372 family glycosyltransferase [Sulfurospirillum arsenophilum]
MFDFFKNKIVFIPDYDRNIGNLSEKLFYALQKAKRENKQLLFVRKRLFFKFLFKKIKYKQLNGIFALQSPLIYHNTFLDILFGYIYGARYSFHIVWNAVLFVLKLKRPFTYELMGIGCSNLINTTNETIFQKEIANNIDWAAVYNDRLEIDLDKKDVEICKEALANLGVTMNEWYVCLHIRTSHYHKDPDSFFRNSSPENYLTAINYISLLGGKVIRLGDPVDMSINQYCIDYPNSKYKSELMDLYLIKNCKFYMGTNSGILDTAFLFGTPVLGVNYSDFCLTKLFKDCDKVLYKHMIDKKTGKELTIENIFQKPMYINPNINEFYINKFHEDYEVHENTPEEILLATKEMLSDLECPKQKNELDKVYDEIVLHAICRWIKEENGYFLDNIEEPYRLYQRTYCSGKVCNFYLKKQLI